MESLLISAIRRQGELAMPPDDPLSEEQVRVIHEWIEAGAPWPKDDVNEVKETLWSLRPVVNHAPPAVRDHTWPRNTIDSFILAKLEEKGLHPAPPADRRTLIRRAYFDLIGLPPTPAEIHAFVEDPSPDAFEKVVDQLLADPAYGERWGRHWLDLVRFAETNGFEYDTQKPYAYQYRDYVIDAFNQDLPYDQFLREFFAGDLLPEQRRSADGKRFVSAIGTHALWFQEILQFPVDWPLARAEEIENQIDVIGKSVLGLTVACARCHDHKFDPISTADYYSLAGSLMSTECIVRCIDTPEVVRESEAILTRIQEVDQKIEALRAKAMASAEMANRRFQEARLVSRYLLAIREIIAHAAQTDSAKIDRIAAKHSVSSEPLKRWLDELTRDTETDSIFRPWFELCTCATDVFDYRRKGLAQRSFRINERPPFGNRSPCRVLGDFEGGDYGDWKAEGLAFGSGPEKSPPVGTTGIVGNGVASSYRGTNAATGRLVSPKFPLVGPVNLLAFRIAGGAQPGKLCVNLIVNDQSLVYELTHSITGKNNHSLQDVVLPLAPAIPLGQGVEVFVELVDESTGDWGHLIVDDVRLIDDVNEYEYRDERLLYTNSLIASLLANPEPMSPTRCAKEYEDLISSLLLRWQMEIDEYVRKGNVTQSLPASLLSVVKSFVNPDQRLIVEWAIKDDSLLVPEKDWSVFLGEEDRKGFALLREEKAKLENDLPESAFAMSCRDYKVRDIKVQKKGNPHNLGPTIPALSRCLFPRRFFLNLFNAII